MIRPLFISLMLLVGAPSTTLAASFDCGRAATETEIAICADSKLSALDEGLYIAYQDIFVSNFDDATERLHRALQSQGTSRTAGPEHL